jgi:outer membrane protein assembly factor BamB
MERCFRNVIGLALATVLAGIVFSATPTPSLASAISVVTYHYNNYRTGANTSETVLTPANVNVSHFGKLFSLPVDGGIYAQPLYVPNVAISGRLYNIVYVATRNNSIYAFDADNGATLWSRNLGPAQPPPPYCAPVGKVGILGTPVITGNTLYAVAATLRNGTERHELHALNISTGAEQPHSPAIITASVHGTGYGSVGGTLTFNSLNQNQRPALLSDNGSVYVGFGVYCDIGPDSARGHGWIFAYNASTLQLESNFMVTPNGLGGGIWASGGGPAADSNHHIYFSTGAGTFDVDRGGVDYGDSVLKLSSGSLSLIDYFTPLNQAYLESNGLDLGSGGILLMPPQSTTPPNLVVTAGKQGFIYVINRANLGHYTMSQVVQENPYISGLWGTPAFWNNRLYFAGSNYSGDDSPKVFSVSGGRMSTVWTSRASSIYPYPGAVPVVSANGTNNGILWVLQHGGSSSGNDVLRAYNALNLANALYNSDEAGSRDLPGVVGNQFESIIVDNGKVYVPSTGQSQLSVYGLLP